jgi:hypothetical protein
LAIDRGEAAELDQARLARVQRQGERRQPLCQFRLEAFRIGLVLEAHDDVIGITHDNHVASSLAPSPALGP